MKERLTAGKMHWSTWSILAMLLIIVIVAVVSYLPQLTKPEYARTGDSFIQYLNEGKLSEAGKLLSASIAEKDRNLEAAWGPRAQMTGFLEKQLSAEIIDSPTDLDHPQAAEAKRIDYAFKGELRNMTIILYLIPEGGTWKIIRYDID